MANANATTTSGRFFQEPASNVTDSAQPARFVILEHDYPVLHWDLMLQDNDRLRSWRLPELPVQQTAIKAEPAPDHRLMYLDYQGPVSGDRGSIVRRDSGSCRWLSETPERIVVQLEGLNLSGTLTLNRAEGGGWTLIVTGESD